MKQRMCEMCDAFFPTRKTQCPRCGMPMRLVDFCAACDRPNRWRLSHGLGISHLPNESPEAMIPRPDGASKALGSDAPLECNVRGGRLIISIGIGVLAFAAKESPFIYNSYSDPGTGEIPPDVFLVTDAHVFALAIRDALTHENEIGESPITALIDQAVEDAIGDGCEGVRIKGDDLD